MTEQPEDFPGPEDHLVPGERGIEAPTTDAVEQALPSDPTEQRTEIHRGLEINEWDAVEQARIVDLDDDDYR